MDIDQSVVFAFTKVCFRVNKKMYLLREGSIAMIAERVFMILGLGSRWNSSRKSPGYCYLCLKEFI